MFSTSSWKTTLGGLLVAVGTALQTSADEIIKAIGTILVGAGALFLGISARDNSKTSEQVNAGK